MNPGGGHFLPPTTGTPVSANGTSTGLGYVARNSTALGSDRTSRKRLNDMYEPGRWSLLATDDGHAGEREWDFDRLRICGPELDGTRIRSDEQETLERHV